jgi:Flp pilus assembly protein TadG
VRARRRPAPGGPGRRRRGNGEHGQATVELALVLPLVAVLLLALVQVAVVARDQVLVAHAAREAARAAAVDGDVDVARGAAERAGPLAADRLTVSVSGRDGVGSRVRVVVRYREPLRLPLIGEVVRDLELRSEATMRVER